ncbi:Miro-like protein [Ostertagia ostertagi]
MSTTIAKRMTFRLRSRSSSRHRVVSCLAPSYHSLDVPSPPNTPSNESDYLPSETSPAKRCVSSSTYELLTRPAHPPKSAVAAPLCMGRAMRVVVVGGRRVGKTAILRQVACFEDITSKKYEPTIDDTYQVMLEEADRPREILIFHDTGGLADHGPAELKRPYLQVADAFVLVYSVADHESFNRMDLLVMKLYLELGEAFPKGSEDRDGIPLLFTFSCFTSILYYSFIFPTK